VVDWVNQQGKSRSNVIAMSRGGIERLREEAISSPTCLNHDS